MKFYIRKLNAQELGYRGGRVREAGRYILISKELQRATNFSMDSAVIIYILVSTYFL